MVSLPVRLIRLSFLIAQLYWPCVYPLDSVLASSLCSELGKRVEASWLLELAIRVAADPVLSTAWNLRALINVGAVMVPSLFPRPFLLACRRAKKSPRILALLALKSAGWWTLKLITWFCIRMLPLRTVRVCYAQNVPRNETLEACG